MESNDVVTALAALAQATRLQAFRILVRHEPDGIAAGELARLLGVPQNTMSAHLSVLARSGLVTSVRQSRLVIYRADLEHFRDLTLFLLNDCCHGRSEICKSLIDQLMPSCPTKETAMSDHVYNVLFLCTGNTARSVLAEGILRHHGVGRFNAFSAGSRPKGVINPFALKVLKSYGYPVDGFRSKSWEEFAAPDAPVMDFVFTVCDSAAGESCPVWPGQPMTAHWGVADPAAVEGTDLETEAAFVQAFKQLRNRVSVFASLPIHSIGKLALSAEIKRIGKLDGATDMAKNG